MTTACLPTANASVASTPSAIRKSSLALRCAILASDRRDCHIHLPRFALYAGDRQHSSQDSTPAFINYKSENSMRIHKLVSLVATIGVVAAHVVSGSLYADGAETSGAKVTTLMQRALPDFPGKEGLVVAVEFAPGPLACRVGQEGPWAALEALNPRRRDS